VAAELTRSRSADLFGLRRSDLWAAGLRPFRSTAIGLALGFLWAALADDFYQSPLTSTPIRSGVGPRCSG
jgi:hypothetical protein